MGKKKEKKKRTTEPVCLITIPFVIFSFGSLVSLVILGALLWYEMLGRLALIYRGRDFCPFAGIDCTGYIWRAVGPEATKDK